MDRIPLLVVGHEPDWLAQQVADVFRSLPANVQYVPMDHCPERSPACFLAVDDLLWPDLPRTVHKLARRTRRVILLSWADPIDLQVVRGWPLHGVFTFSQELPRFRSFLSTMSAVPRLPDFEFRPDVPGNVVMAVRFLLRHAKSPLGEPPPRSIAALAMRLGMDAGHLGRQSRAIGRHRVKRVVGVPGSLIVFRRGRLSVDGLDLGPYAPKEFPWVLGLLKAVERMEPSSLLPSEWSFEMPAEQYFVLGDRLGASVDSRQLGPIQAASIVGRVWLRIPGLRSLLDGCSPA